MGLITAIMSDAKKTLLEGELTVVITELAKTSVFSSFWKIAPSYGLQNMNLSTKIEISHIHSFVTAAIVCITLRSSFCS